MLPNSMLKKNKINEQQQQQGMINNTKQET
jgi:hypothetical protein